MNRTVPRFASSAFYSPALHRLLRARTNGKLQRVFASFRSPRKRVLAFFCAGLAALWLTNMLAAVLFRQPADVQRLMVWIPFSLLAYSVFHIIKTVAKKATVPFEWTAAEDELVRTAPVSRTQLISYRLTSIFSAGVLKAACFSIVMVPDLPFWIAGFVGMFLGLIFVDLIRVCFEIFYFGISGKVKKWMKIGVLGVALLLIVKVFATCLAMPEASAQLDSPASLVFIQSLLSEFVSLGETPVGRGLSTPFRVFAHVMFVDSVSIASLGFVLSAVAMVATAAAAVFWLDRWSNNSIKSRLKREFQIAASHRTRSAGEGELENLQSENLGGKCSLSWLKPPTATAAIAWRQLLGAVHYRASLIVSLGVPVFLCCLPLFTSQDPFRTLIQVTGAIVFYSFVLLPSALVLDFRRDLNRMFVLKSLPLSPLKITLGQLTAPVLLCSFFQAIVLLIASLTGSVNPGHALIAGVLLVPINVLIFALENYIFLLAPYQRNKEGFDVFIRTILTFMGKSLLFALALVAIVAWVMIANLLARLIGDSHELRVILMAGGVWLFAALLSVIATWGVVRRFVKFDPSQDLPAEA